MCNGHGRWSIQVLRQGPGSSRSGRVARGGDGMPDNRYEMTLENNLHIQKADNK